jgi:phosphoserine aminotransferase
MVANNMMTERVYNFSSGPATLPAEVLQRAAADMLSWGGSGMSVMEMSHRSHEFGRILEEALADLRELLAVPDNFHILLMQGGAIAQNAAVPLNLMHRDGREHPRADYVVTGTWSSKSKEEARKYGQINVVDTDTNGDLIEIASHNTWNLLDDSAYLHLCANETINGVEFREMPDIGQAQGRVLVADVSSNLLSRPIDFTRVAVLYAGAQKNAGPAGLTIVIVREDLLDFSHPICPSAFNWRLVTDHRSMFNTPPTYAIYIAGLVFKWLKKQGGVQAIERRNVAKAKLLYDFLDRSYFYVNRVHPRCRSRMNVPFFLADKSHNDAFIAAAYSHGLVQLKGNKFAGGMRASLYNAMSMEGVQALVDFMAWYEQTAA